MWLFKMKGSYLNRFCSLIMKFFKLGHIGRQVGDIFGWFQRNSYAQFDGFDGLDMLGFPFCIQFHISGLLGIPVDWWHMARVGRLTRHSIPWHTSAMLVTAISWTSSVVSWRDEAGAVATVTIGMSIMSVGCGSLIRACLAAEGFSSFFPASSTFLK